VKGAGVSTLDVKFPSGSDMMSTDRRDSMLLAKERMEFEFFGRFEQDV
jgi:hypothetical protein